MSRSSCEPPCRQNTRLCDEYPRSTCPSTPYQLTSSRQKRLRASDGWALRNAIMPLKKRKMSLFFSNKSQSSQVVSLSWFHGLLLPCCVFMNSSPAQNIGVPFETIRMVKKFLICCFRSCITSAGTSRAPSHPQFQLKLLSVPSVLFWPLAKLCLSL